MPDTTVAPDISKQKVLQNITGKNAPKEVIGLTELLQERTLEANLKRIHQIKPKCTEWNNKARREETLQHPIVVNPLLWEEILCKDRKCNQLDNIGHDLFLCVNDVEKLEI